MPASPKGRREPANHDVARPRPTRHPRVTVHPNAGRRGAALDYGPARPGGAARPSGRTVDVSTIAKLVFGMPWLAYSAAVVGVLAYPIAGLSSTVLVLACWVASGALIFHSRFEALIATRLFGARPPSVREQAVLEPLWRQVARRAEIEPSSYRLWVEDTDQINASAAAGHIVTVTRYALTHLPPEHLAAVLAHELGHHRGGHAWSSLLMYWYSLPARLFTRAMIVASRVALGVFGAVVSFIVELPFLLMVAGLFLVGSFLVSLIGGVGVLVARLADAGNYVLPALIVLALLSPVLSPWFGRHAELGADRAAADLGYGAELIEYLDDEQRAGMPVRAEMPLRVRLLGSHPPVDVRRRSLLNYLRRSGTA
ncbi:MAG TPA: M48 family metalloprotease [Jiangellaceae bacterium]